MASHGLAKIPYTFKLHPVASTPTCPNRIRTEEQLVNSQAFGTWRLEGVGEYLSAESLGTGFESGSRSGRFSAPFSHGKLASRMAMLSAVVACVTPAGGIVTTTVVCREWRIRWLRP